MKTSTDRLSELLRKNSKENSTDKKIEILYNINSLIPEPLQLTLSPSMSDDYVKNTLHKIENNKSIFRELIVSMNKGCQVIASNVSFLINAVPTVIIIKDFSILFSEQSINLQLEIIPNLSSNNNKQFLVNKKHENSYPCPDGSNIGFHGIVMSQQVHTISVPYYTEVVKSKPE